MISSHPWQIENPTSSRVEFPVTLASVVNTRLLKSFPASF
jgi:hypothetical protein